MSDLDQYLNIINSFSEKREYFGEGPGKYHHKTALSVGVYEGPASGEGVINPDSTDESIQYAFNTVNNTVLLFTSHTMNEIDEYLSN